MVKHPLHARIAGPIVIDIETEGLPSRQLRLNAVAPRPY